MIHLNAVPTGFFRAARRRAMLVIAAFAVFAGNVDAATYYFSATGDDTTGAGTIASPWASLSKLNTVSLGDGDQFLLRGGDTFSGNVSLYSSTLANYSNGITLSSYGTGRATISTATADAAISVGNVGGFTASNLNLVGSSVAKNGIDAYTTYTTGDSLTLRGARVSSFSISNVSANNFEHGVAIGSWDNRYGNHNALAIQGYDRITIDGLTTFNNRQNGLMVWGQTTLNNKNVNVTNSLAYGNGGNGLLVYATQGGSIQYSIAHNNGNNSDGTVGIWTFDSSNMLIQYNESYANKTTGTHDGGGFDLDGGTTNSVMQYNYSHDNDGAGYLLGEYSGSSNTSGNTIRYNISQNDGQKNGYAGIYIYNFGTNTKVTGNYLYNNTVFNSSGGSALVLQGDLSGAAAANLVANNILMTANGVKLVNDQRSNRTAGVKGVGGVQLVDNDYYATGAFKIVIGSTTYTSVTAWLNAVIAQERLDSDSNGVLNDSDLRLAVVLNPQFVGGSDPTLLGQITAYALLTSSEIKDAGLNLPLTFGLNVGGQDYFGYQLPMGGGYAIGASEIPEPTGTAGLLLAAGLFLRRRRAAF